MPGKVASMFGHLKTNLSFRNGLPDQRQMLRGIPAYLVLYALTYLSAIVIHYRFSMPGEALASFWATLPLVVLAKSLVCFLTGEWKLSLRSASAQEMRTVMLGAAASGLVIYLSNLLPLPKPLYGISAITILLDALLTLLVAFSLRILSSPEPTTHLQPALANSAKTQAVYLSFSSLLLVLSLVLYYCRLSHVPESQLLNWFNADTLLSFHVIEDVVIHGNSLSGWRLPPAPFVFPDLMFAFLGRGVSANPAMVTFLAGALTFLLVGGSAIYTGMISTNHRRAAMCYADLAEGEVVIV
jgi:hypothetical protein